MHEAWLAKAKFDRQRLRRDCDRAIIASAVSNVSLRTARCRVSENYRLCSIAATKETQRAMPVREPTPKISTKLKVVMELRRHLQLSPEEYRLLVAHIVRDHLAEKRRAPSRRRERKVA
jgi:hypothetical protein